MSNRFLIRPFSPVLLAFFLAAPCFAQQPGKRGNSSSLEGYVYFGAWAKTGVGCPCYTFSIQPSEDNPTEDSRRYRVKISTADLEASVGRPVPLEADSQDLYKINQFYAHKRVKVIVTNLHRTIDPNIPNLYTAGTKRIVVIGGSVKLRRLNGLNLLNDPRPQDEKLLVRTVRGDVVITNVFKRELATNGDYFTFYSWENNHWLDYEPHDTSFVIHGVAESSTTEFERDRQVAERVLLSQLGITQPEACKLRAFTLTLGTHNKSWKFKKWPLSFCAKTGAGKRKQ